ncbi:MAG: cyanoexosortase A [Cyanobacteria bacterium P01_F01_bin.86]
MIALFLVVGIQAPTASYLAIGPFMATLGLALLVSGWRHLMQYRSELGLMFVFGIPKVLLWPIVDLRETTARFASLILNFLGFNALQEGVIISLPTGSVEVIQDCSGLNGMLYLLAISVLLLVMLPLKGTKQYFTPLLGITIAYCFNGIRVAWLAIMAANPDPAKFNAWHSTSIFSLGALGLFCGMYCLLLWQEKRAKFKAT